MDCKFWSWKGQRNLVAVKTCVFFVDFDWLFVVVFCFCILYLCFVALFFWVFLFLFILLFFILFFFAITSQPFYLFGGTSGTLCFWLLLTLPIGFKASLPAILSCLFHNVPRVISEQGRTPSNNVPHVKREKDLFSVHSWLNLAFDWLVTLYLNNMYYLVLRELYMKVSLVQYQNDGYVLNNSSHVIWMLVDLNMYFSHKTGILQ